MKHTIKILCLSIIFLGNFSFLALAGDSIDKKIDDYGNVMQVKQNFAVGIEKQEQIFASFLFLKNPNITLDQRQKVIAIINQTVPTFNDQMLDAWKQSVKSVYTEQEIDKLIQFYSSPEGQSIISKNQLLNLKVATSQQIVQNQLMFPTILQKLKSDDLTKTLNGL